jgi:hypothetical protein
VTPDGRDRIGHSAKNPEIGVSVPKIVFTTKSVSNWPRFTEHIHRILRKPIGDVRSTIDKKALLAEWTLFMNDHDDVARQIRDLLTIEERGEGTFQIFELMFDEEFSNCQLDQCEISAAALRTILDAHDDRRRQRETEN